MYACICVYVCICVRICTNACICTHLYASVYICIHVYTPLYTAIPPGGDRCIQGCIHMYTFVCERISPAPCSQTNFSHSRVRPRSPGVDPHGFVWWVGRGLKRGSRVQWRSSLDTSRWWPRTKVRIAGIPKNRSFPNFSHPRWFVFAGPTTMGGHVDFWSRGPRPTGRPR